MAKELEGKVAVVTGAAWGIGLASTEAMLAAGSIRPIRDALLRKFLSSFPIPLDVDQPHSICSRRMFAMRAIS